MESLEANLEVSAFYDSIMILFSDLKFNNKIIYAFIVLSILALIGLIFCACNGNLYYLELLDGETGLTKKRLPIDVGEAFSIQFIHSVEKTPVIETFYVNSDGNIILKKVKFKKIGVGYGKYIRTLYPSSYKNGWFYMEEIHKQAILNYRVGYIAKHTLLLRHQTYSFEMLVPPGGLLKIVVRSIFNSS